MYQYMNLLGLILSWSSTTFMCEEEIIPEHIVILTFDRILCQYH